MKPLHSLLVRICTATILGVCVLLSAHSAPERMAAQADVDKLQDQVHALDKDVGVFSAKLDAQDKRIQDIQSITASQANHIGMVANHTTTLGNWIAWVGALITLAVFIGGFISFRFKDKAIEEAKRAAKFEAKEWFEQREKELQIQINKLEEKALEGVKAIQQNVRLSDELVKTQLENVGSGIVERAHSANSENQADESSNNFSTHELQPPTIYFPEKRNAEELFAKGLALSRQRDFDRAISVYEEITSSYSTSKSTPVQEIVALALLQKAACLLEKNDSKRSIEVLDSIVKSYGTNETNSLRETVTLALLNKGNVLLIYAKRDWHSPHLRQQHLAQAQISLEDGLTRNSIEFKPLLLGFLGYALYLQGNTSEAVKRTSECLKLGDTQAFQALSIIAERPHLEPQDTDYKAMLACLWNKPHHDGNT